MKPVPALLVVALAAALVPDASAQHPMRPGNWEVSMQMEMPGMPMQMPPMKATQCVTAEQLKAPEKAVPTGPGKNPNDCKVSDYKVSGNTVTWSMVCAGPEPMSGSSSAIWAGLTSSSFSVVTTSCFSRVMSGSDVAIAGNEESPAPRAAAS